MSLLPVLDANGNQVSYLPAGYFGPVDGGKTNITDARPLPSMVPLLDTTFGAKFWKPSFGIDFSSANNSVMTSRTQRLRQSTVRHLAREPPFASGANAGYNFALARVWQ